MPEFFLDHRSTESASEFRKLDAFTQGYVEALFFCGVPDESGDSDADVSLDDLSLEAWQLIKEDCHDFQSGPAGEILFAIYASDIDYSPNQAGTDFWFTRCRHGAGFWDRGQLEADGMGKRLSEFARQAGNVNAYLGDDGKIYLS